MKSKNIFFSAVVVFFTFISSSKAYRQIIDLGSLGTNPSYAYSINNTGQVVGGAYNAGGYERACLYDTTGGGSNKDLGILPSRYFSEADSINDKGQIVGYASNPSSARACLFDSTGGGANINLGTLSAYTFTSFAYSINNKGQIVGMCQASYSGSFHQHACLFDSTGGGANIYLGTLGGDWSAANSINDNGQIVGYAANKSDNSCACIFDSTGGKANKDLGTLGGSWSVANFTNNNGQIVGTACNSLNLYHACLFDPTGAGVNIDLGEGEAYCINDNGQIVGTSNGHAYLFDPTGNGNNIDLNTIIDPSSRWLLEEATSINDDGWIVGYGMHFTDSQTFSHAFLITPEPATLLLLALGSVVLRKRKK